MTLKVFTAAMFASPILALLNMDGFAVDILEPPQQVRQRQCRWRHLSGRLRYKE